MSRNEHPVFAAAILFVTLCAIGCSAPTKSKTVQQDKTNISRNADLYLPDDLEATLWAESPMFYNPTNMDVDIRGRIWVTEAVNYRNFNNDSATFFHHSGGDRVMILEDTNGDGKADSSKVFVEDHDLVSPVGIAVIGNKVIVSCSPNLIVYTDENGDDKPDKKEILLTGFGGLDHDHSLHAVFAGPDGNWYFNTGNAGPHVVTDKSGWTLRSGSLYVGGTPYSKGNHGNMKSDDGKVWVGGLALRIRPDGTGLKVVGHNFRNSYEIIPDSYGNLWQNDNDDQVVACRTTWLMEGGNAGYFSSDGTRFWQADQRPGQNIFTAHWHQEDPGIMPAGDCSGAGAPTGIVVNESAELGQQYLGMLLSADAGRNVIFGYHPAMTGSGYELGKRSNFITSLSNDNPGYVWNDSLQNQRKEKSFRPSDVTIGTDGAIYISDWYDPVVGGHQMKDQKGYGRIFRITPKNKTLKSPHIDISTVQGQLAAMISPAINVRNQAFEKLKTGGEQAIRSVRPLLMDKNPYVRARATWLLAALHDKATMETLLTNNDPLVRATAYRALRSTETDILPYARRMCTDSAAFVRREVAISLRDVPYAQSRNILLELIKNYDGKDKWYLETLGTDLAGHEADIYPEVLKMFSENKPASEWNRQMSTLAWRLHPAAAITALSERACSTALDSTERKAALTALAFVNDKAAAESMNRLSKNNLQDVSEEAAYWLSFRQGNDWYKLLDWGKVSVNIAYEKKLAEMKVRTQILVDEHQSLNERKSQLQKMARDSVGGQLLIGLAAANRLTPELMQLAGEKIFLNPDVSVRVQAGKYFKRKDDVKSYPVEDILKLAADEKRGKTVFSGSCSSCHRIGNEGNTIGPELSEIGKKFDKKELLDAIINPSAAIVFGYEPWLVNRKDGGSVYGFLISDNKEMVVLKDLSGKKHVIPVKDIVSKEKQEKSLMPEPRNNGLTEQNLADVAQFLLKGK